LEEALAWADACVLGAGTLRAHHSSCLIHQPDLLAQRLARAQGMDPALCCGLRERRSRGYRPYVGGLRLWNGEQLQALEQVSPLVASLSQAQELAWVLHPREVRQQLRQQLPAAAPQP
jgi:hypothetical protein